jgi:hypothetical protein
LVEEGGVVVGHRRTAGQGAQSMRKYLDFFLVVAMFGVVFVGGLAVSGRIDHRFGSLGDALAWLIR